MNISRTPKNELNNTGPIIQHGIPGLLAAILFGFLMLSLLGLPFWLPMLVEGILAR